MFEFTYKEGEYLEASIVFNNKTITARHSSHFTKHLDSNIYFFSNDSTYDEFDFYDFIKDFTIEHIPNQVEFNIYSIYRNKIENPLQNVPYPFNTLSFLKIDDIFIRKLALTWTIVDGTKSGQ